MLASPKAFEKLISIALKICTFSFTFFFALVHCLLEKQMGLKYWGIDMGTLRKQNFAIEGMSCAACKARIERAVSKVEGVEDVSVQLLQNSMSVRFSDESCSDEAIVKAVVEAGYGAHAVTSQALVKRGDDSEIATNQKKLIGSIVLTLVLMIFSMGPMVGIDILPLAEANANTQLGLTLLVIALNLHYFKSGFKALKALSPNMDSLVAIGAAASFIYSCYGMMLIPQNMPTMHMHDFPIYFESVASILTLVSVGKFLENKAKHKAVNAIYALYDLAPDTVNVRRPQGKGQNQQAQGQAQAKEGGCENESSACASASKNTKATTTDSSNSETSVDSSSEIANDEVNIPLSDVKVGDLIVLRAGDRVGVDGTVVEGSGFFDESALTGEPIPVKKEIGAQVSSATFLRTGFVVYKVEKVGADTTLAKIIALVDEANSKKAPISRLADRVAFYFVPAVIGLALLTAIVWYSIGYSLDHAITFAVCVLVVSCPCALGLATPTAIMVATGRAATLGILFKTPEALERLQNVDIMVMDKTGTITVGKMDVLDCSINDLLKLDKQRVMAMAYALESRSEHPVGLAIREYCRKNLDEANIIKAEDIEDFIVHKGMGVELIYNSKSYYLGSPSFMHAKIFNKETTNKYTMHAIEQASNHKDNHIVVHLFDDELIYATFYLGDEIKPSSRQAVSELRAAHIRPVMISGDSLKVVQYVSAQVGIDTFKALCLPDDKASLITKLREKNHVVAMVGDGINDAPSLSSSDVGISIAGSTDIATSCASVILMRDDLTALTRAVELSYLTIKNIKQNLFWAFFYNVICIPLAAGVFFIPFGWQLSPMIAAALMSLSSLCVVSNALRLRTQELKLGTDRKELMCRSLMCNECDKDGHCANHRYEVLPQDPLRDLMNYVYEATKAAEADEKDELTKSAKSKPIADMSDEDVKERSSLLGKLSMSVKAHSHIKKHIDATALKEHAGGKILGSDIHHVHHPHLEDWVHHAELSISEHQEGLTEGLAFAQNRVLHGVPIETPVDIVLDDANEEVKGTRAEGKLVEACKAVNEPKQSSDDKSAAKPSSPSSNSQIVKIIAIEGMSCQHCVKSVTKALNALENCKVLEVSLERKEAVVEICCSTDSSNSALVSDDALKAAVVDAGFEVVKVFEKINQAESKDDAKEVIMSKIIHIEGMSCQHCVKAVTKALSAIDGCSVDEVSLDNKLARVTLDSSKGITDEALKAAVVDADFEVTAIENA